MMTDEELLKAAAKAAGLNPSDYPADVQYWAWNPLLDDGDALRLAVALEIDISFDANYVLADGVQQPTVNNANDPCAAVRYAIVRAAADLAPR